MSDLIRLNPDGLRLVRSNVDGMEIGGWPTEIGEVMILADTKGCRKLIGIGVLEDLGKMKFVAEK